MKTLNKIFIDRKFNCSAPELFEYLVQPHLIAKWFGPKHMSVGTVITEFKIGGKYSIELKKTDQKKFFIEGEYLEIDIPKKLSFSFQYKRLSPTPPDSTVKITIAAISGIESHLYLEQDFILMPTDLGNRTKSWEYMFQKLSEQLL